MQRVPRHEVGPRDPNTIYVGKKNTMAYVLAAVTQFNTGSPEVKLKARGRSISTAFDVEEIVKNRFFPALQIKSVNVSTEDVTSMDGRATKVTSVEIVLQK
ncbi:MAG: DNA-binding protein Alba [Candidatus Micrarchaeia archaeon]